MRTKNGAARFLLVKVVNCFWDRLTLIRRSAVEHIRRNTCAGEAKNPDVLYRLIMRRMYDTRVRTDRLSGEPPTAWNLYRKIVEIFHFGFNCHL